MLYSWPITSFYRGWEHISSTKLRQQRDTLSSRALDISVKPQTAFLLIVWILNSLCDNGTWCELLSHGRHVQKNNKIKGSDHHVPMLAERRT